MTPDAMAAIHATSFTTPRPWSAAEIADVLGQNGAFLLTRPDAFLIGRVTLDEAELLTLAVAPAARRHGTGRALVEGFARAAATRGATGAFLEVAADNQPAQALYAATGWQAAGRRRGYYGAGMDALILWRDLSALAKSG